MSTIYQKQRVTRIQHACTTLCDICKQPISNSHYQHNEATIQAKEGSVYQAGRRGYVLTLSTREQHIRREKATSNICTNQPEGDTRKCIELDCCIDCFQEKVQPLLERELGVKFRERDADDFDLRGDCTIENLGDPFVK